MPQTHAPGPCRACPPPPVDDRTRLFTASRPAMNVLSCFIVEDSAVIRQNLVATLQELLPLQCVGEAEDEAGALAWLRSAAPVRLVIIDIFLKAGSGLDVLRQARSLRPEAHLVVLTNFATPDMRRRCAQLGADRVFDKSAELDELIAYCEALASGA